MIDTSMLPDFIVEAAEHLEELENSLLKLEQGKGKENREVMDELFRAVHTIKGAAQFVGIDRVAGLSHKLENLLDLIRKGSQPLTPAVTDLLIEGKDRLALLVEELERSQAEESEVDDLLARIKNIVEGGGEESAAPPQTEVPQPYEEPRKGSLAEESMTEEYDEELYSIFLQQLKENIPFLYAQTVELSISVDKQDVLYRCSDSIKSLKSSANYMGYEKLTKHYTDWQKEISTAVEQLSAGKMPNLGFMQNYIDEIIRSFPQAMEGYSQEDAAQVAKKQKSNAAVLDDIFSAGPHEEEKRKETTQVNDLDDVLNDIFSDDDEEEDGPVAAQGSAAVDEDDEEPEEEEKPQLVAAATFAAPERKKSLQLEYELSEDEYDQELVAIFLKKLQTDMRFLREQAEEMSVAADKKEVLERCREAVARLASSANYMEYHSLAAFCREWQQVLQEHADALVAGRSPDADSALRRFMEEIVKIYPQAVEVEAGQTQAPPQPSAPAAVTAAADAAEFDGAADIIESFLSPPSVVEEKKTTALPKPTALIIKEAAPEPPLPTATVEVEEKVDDSELFTRLSNALELSMSPQDDAAEYQMDNVIERIMDKPEAEKTEVTLDEEPPKPAFVAASEKKSYAEKPVVIAAVEPEWSAEPQPSPIEMQNAAESLPITEEEPSQEIAEDEDTDAPRKTEVKKPAARSSIRVDAEKIDYLMNQVGELVVSRAYFAQLVNEMRGLQLLLQERAKLTKAEMKPLHEFAFRLSEAGVHLGRVSNELQEGVMKIRMLPIDQLFKRYPRLVRDLTHRTDKDIRLITKGEETELDKMVIESISDPLIHIIRNAVDHGIETISERKRLGKVPQGSLTLEAYHESDHIVVEITDDGRGIDPKRIRAKALEKDLFDKEELDRMSEEDIIRIIMEPGFSTAEKTTETSGRGVGMDVVRKNVERLNGMIEISSKVGQGTRMRIKIPLTMAIIQALMVRVGKEKFTIPLTSVEETLRIFRHDISQIEGVDVIYIRDTTMPIFRLAKIYSIDRSMEDEEKMFVVVVSTGTQEVGLVVDELLGQEEVVIKPLADYLRAGSGFGGATILGDGGISLILDIPELVKIAGEDQAEKQARRTLSFKRKRRRGTEEEQPQVVH
ncbi:chemotaxis protein CheW [Candidatus Electronema sp. PJ]|uniref:chemotaxis protein CheW n=1 Tax=Candidatus Electronema sp. PJ TaxID=3401572 RepID=UPI003AA95FD3